MTRFKSNKLQIRKAHSTTPISEASTDHSSHKNLSCDLVSLYSRSLEEKDENRLNEDAVTRGG